VDVLQRLHPMDSDGADTAELVQDVRLVQQMVFNDEHVQGGGAGAIGRRSHGLDEAQWVGIVTGTPRVQFQKNRAKPKVSEVRDRFRPRTTSARNGIP
jgi:hypothetical protein